MSENINPLFYGSYSKEKVLEGGAVVSVTISFEKVTPQNGFSINATAQILAEKIIEEWLFSCDPSNKSLSNRT